MAVVITIVSSGYPVSAGGVAAVDVLEVVLHIVVDAGRTLYHRVGYGAVTYGYARI